MNNQDINNQEEFIMPTSISRICGEIHEIISKIEDEAAVLEIKNRMLRGESTPLLGEEKSNKTGRIGLVGRFQDAIDRLRRLNTFMNDNTKELESHLG